MYMFVRLKICKKYLKKFKKYVDKIQFIPYNNSCISDEAVAKVQIEAWLSLVERCVRDAEVVGSNPVASTLGRGTGNQN